MMKNFFQSLKMITDNNLFHHPLYSAKFFLLYYCHNLRLTIPVIFFLFMSLTAAQVSSAAAEENGIVRDSQQLISFKNSLSNPNELVSWQPTISPCNFDGVSCKNSRVSSIDLSNYRLNADLSKVASFLLPLQNLESLVLKNANISGSVSSVSRLSCTALLKSLDLSENAISGPVTDIPALGVCSGLVSLNLSKNSMDPFVKGGGRASGLPSSLQVLDLSYNNISGENVVSWLLSSALSGLQYLSLKGNKVSGVLPEFNFKNCRIWTFHEQYLDQFPQIQRLLQLATLGLVFQQILW
ncbi:UNVERIFIED_CONTAM: Systemin receptor [Sesamum radiatum]|uniref:Systemin receptor n=1 Tax=Sesamum radiatum TaxID=300843 RepID=A0AAW2P1S3_SESRA